MTNTQFGLPPTTINDINKVFKKYPQINKVIIYGSRAKGNYHNGSDIDLTIIGENIDLQLLHTIELDLDELMIPYKIDLSIYDHIHNNDLKEHIQRVGQIYYQNS